MVTSLLFGLLAAPLSSFLFFSAASGMPSAPLAPRDAAVTRLGCFKDVSPRIFSAGSKSDNQMTVEMCAAFCWTKRYFGLEYGRECYCNEAPPSSALTAPSSDCSFACAGNNAQKCGAGMRLDAYINNAYTAPAPPTVSGAPYLGCFNDASPRVLPERLLATNDMTYANCRDNCAGYKYFGIEYARECWCGNTAPASPAPGSECNMACAGDATAKCGAGMRLTVFGPVTAPPPPSTNPQTVADFAYEGCYTDALNPRALIGIKSAGSSMTLQSCAAFCSSYTFFGTENSDECFCGMALDASSTKTPESNCQKKCAGNSTLLCGDARRLSLYKKTTPPQQVSSPQTVGAYTYKSCWTDDVSARSLAAKWKGADDMTVEKCAAFCDGHSFFGVEYATQCFCGDVLSGGVAAPEAECGQLCGGSSAQWCGAADRLNVYEKTPVPTSSSAAPSSSSFSPAPSSVAPSSAVPSSNAPWSTNILSSTSLIASSTLPSSFATSIIPSSSLSSSVPSSVSSSALSTITPGPQLTTITNCPLSSTWAGYPTSCWAQLPSACNALTSSAIPYFIASMSADDCSRQFGYPAPSAISSCFPRYFGPTNTASTIYSCMQSAGILCSYASQCTTATYPVDEIPTVIATPTPTAIVVNSGFEKGDLSGWTLDPPTYGFVSTVVPGRSHNGSLALRNYYSNDNGFSSRLSQTLAVEPGATYTASFWWSHDNPSAWCGITLVVNPPLIQPFTDTRNVSPGVWREVSLTFKAVASYTVLSVNFYCNVGQVRYVEAYRNNIYLDDIDVIRVSA